MRHGDNVVDQLKLGTTIRLYFNNPISFKTAIINRFAELPEFTNTEYLQPIHFENSSSNFIVKSPFVSFGYVLSHSINASISSLEIVSFASGIFMLFIFLFYI